MQHAFFLVCPGVFFVVTPQEDSTASSRRQVKAVACGGWHTAVVGEKGGVWTCGRGEYGRLGLGDQKSQVLLYAIKEMKAAARARLARDVLLPSELLRSQAMAAGDLGCVLHLFLRDRRRTRGCVLAATLSFVLIARLERQQTALCSLCSLCSICFLLSEPYRIHKRISSLHSGFSPPSRWKGAP